MRVKLALILMFALVGCLVFLTPNRVLYAKLSYQPASTTLFNIEKPDSWDDFDKVAASFSKSRYRTLRKNDWDLRLGGLNYNGDRDWLMVPFTLRERNRIRDLGPMDWSEEIAVPVLYPLRCPTGEACGRIRIPPVSSGKRIEDENVNPHIAKPVVGHMYVVRTYRKVASSFYSDFKDGLDFYSLVRVEELKPNESCRITWKTIPSPEKKK